MRVICLAILLSLASPALVGPGVRAANEELIERELLIRDTRQMARLLETVHPDPYIRAGGKIAFHRRFQDLLGSIPDQGMTRVDFFERLAPFVSAVGDGHTRLNAPYSYGFLPGGIPLRFEVVDRSLYVKRVFHLDHQDMIGARLVSVLDVPVDELMERQKGLRAGENDYHVLANLGRGTLWLGPELKAILPEWENRSEIEIALLHRDGEMRSHTFSIPVMVVAPGLAAPSKLKLPDTSKSDLVFDFLDPDRETALLIVDGMMSYREAFEMWRSMGLSHQDGQARSVYSRYHGEKAPASMDEVIAGLPSATDLFRSLVQEMKMAKTRTLLIDLRRNDGGNSVMSNILLYFLYGRDTLLSVKEQRTEIRKLSDYYFQVYDSESLDEINMARAVPLRESDYDFIGDFARFQDLVDLVPTFAAEYESGEFENHYLPENVVVLSSRGTFSSGFTLMYYLYRAGATVVGTPSAQAGNCFGDTLNFTLVNSGLSGTVSHKYFEYFPEDPEMGGVLRPHHEMTYERLAAHEFDPNAEILLALEMVGEPES